MIIGYKATDSEIRCNGYQFVPGEWHVHKGPVKKCESGFHFCRDKNGVFNYYSWPCRIWKVEAEEVENLPLETGTLAKFVCRRIRLIEEITTEFENKGNNSGNQNSGNQNSGNQNSGDRNSGDRNSGNQNSGNKNYGYGNSGYGNSGYRNSGDLNSGDRNSGDRNSGYRNSGDLNSGYRNSGDLNSGDRNSGDRNSGYGNSGNYNIGNNNSGDYNTTNESSGLFCQKQDGILCFDGFTGLSKKDLLIAYPEILDLQRDLKNLYEPDFERYKRIPNITKEKLKSLYEKFKENANRNS